MLEVCCMMRLRGFSEELDGELDGFRKNKLRLAFGTSVM